MRCTALFILMVSAAGCDGDPAHLPGDTDEGSARLRRILGPHLSVIEELDAAYVCRVKTDPMARADARDPAPMTRFLGYQEVEAASAAVEAADVAWIRSLLLDEQSFDLDRSVPGLPAPCRWILVLRAGEEARAVGIDLERSLVDIRSGTPAQSPVRLLVEGAAMNRLRSLTTLPMKAVR